MTQNLDMFYKFFSIFLVIICLTRYSDLQPLSSIRVALITDAPSSTNWTGVFQRALELRDKRQHLEHDVKFEFLTVSKNDLQSFKDILDMLCHELLPRQVHAVFLPHENSVPNDFIQFIGLFPVLSLGTKRDPAFENQDVFTSYKFLQPPLTRQSEVIQGILDFLQVNKYAIIYEMQQGNQKLAKEIISGGKTNADYVLEALLPAKDLYDGATKVLVAEKLVKIKIQEVKVMVLACREQSVETVLEVARDLGMVSEHFLWIGTEAVVRATNKTSVGITVSNFIGIQLNTSEETIAMNALQILSLLVKADFDFSFVTVLPSINESCFGDQSLWIPRKMFLSHLEHVNARSSFNQKLLSDAYAILKHENNNSVNARSWMKIGTYRYKESIQIQGSILGQLSRIPHSTSKALRIVTIVHGQYLYKVGGVLGCEGGELCTKQSLQRRSLQPSCEVGVPCYEHAHSRITNDTKRNNTEELYVFCVSGLMVDLLGLIQHKLGFNYELYLVPDGKYGAIDDGTGRWNGMIGEVLYGYADMALGSITINAQRSQVVDFTSPYGEVGIGMMISNGYTARPLITMEFLEPFGTSLWLAIVTTILTILVALWFLDRKTGEFYSKIKRPFLERENKYFKRRQRVTLLESMSYTWSTFVHVPAGNGFPRSLSARFVAIFFAFAMIILSSTYTANLAANKVKDEAEPPITGIHDEKMLNPPPGFRFGTLKSSSTEAYFKFNRDPRMRKIYQNMKDHSVENVHDGVKKVKSGEISVYIDDQPYLEHMVSSQHNCSLRIVGEPFGISGYGLVLRKQSSWTQPLSNSIQQFSDNNVLADLWSKWLVRKCLKKEDFEKTPDRLSVHNFNGVFVLVAAGIFVSILFLGFERMVAPYYRANRKRNLQKFERKYSSHETFADYFADKFPSTPAGLNTEREKNVKSEAELTFASSNPGLQLETWDYDHEVAEPNSRLKFNSIC